MTPEQHAALGRKIHRNLNGMIAELEQLIEDKLSWNDANQQERPFDVEANRVLLAQLRKDRELFLEGRSHEIDPSVGLMLAESEDVE
jgi:hypothetical protein